MERRPLFVFLLFLALTGVAGVIILCSASVVTAKGPINIGFTFDFSGVVAQVGLQEAPVVEMVVKEVNSAGGINGRPIKLHTQDNGSDPSRLVGQLKMLKELYGCSGILSGINSTCGIAAKAWADKNHVPVISEGPMTDQVLQKEGKAWFFKTCGSTTTHAESTLLRLKELGHTKVALEASTLAWGTDSLKVLKKHAPNYGIEVVGEVLCEPKSKDLTIQAMKLRDTGARAVVCCDYPAEQGVWARGCKTIGWKPYQFQYGPGIMATALRIYPIDLFEGWETSQISDNTKPAVRKLWDKYEAFTGKRYEDDLAPRTWDAIRLLLEAVKLSGDPDNPKAVREGFYKIKDFPIACGRIETMGSFEIGRNELLTPRDILIYTVRSGKLLVVH